MGRKKKIKQGLAQWSKDVMMTYSGCFGGGCFARGFHLSFMSFNTSCAMVTPMKRVVSTLWWKFNLPFALPTFDSWRAEDQSQWVLPKITLPCSFRNTLSWVDSRSAVEHEISCDARLTSHQVTNSTEVLVGEASSPSRRSCSRRSLHAKHTMVLIIVNWL